MHFSPPNLGGNGGASYSPNVAYLARWGEGVVVEWFFFSYFPPLKPRCVSWSGASYSLKNTVNSNSNLEETLFSYLMSIPLESFWILFSPQPGGEQSVSLS